MSSVKFSIITAELERRIRQGIYAKKLPTTLQLASEFGVARQTMTNAIRPLVQQGLLISHGKGGLQLQALRENTRCLVAIVTTSVSEGINLSQSLQPLVEILSQEGYEAVLLGLPPQNRLKNPSQFFQGTLSGVLFTASSLSLEIALFLERNRIPFLSCNRLPAFPRLNFVESNAFRGIDHLLTKVTACGYRRIAFFFLSPLDGYDRLIQKEWNRLVKHFGLEDLPCNHVARAAAPTDASARQIFLSTLEHGPRPQLVIFWSSYLGERAEDYDIMRRLAANGIPVLVSYYLPAPALPRPANLFFFQHTASLEVNQKALQALLEIMLARPSKPIHRYLDFQVSLLDELPTPPSF